MTNPWMMKNPVISIWMSGANTAAGMARSAAAAEFGRAQAEATRQAVQFWTDVWMAPIVGFSSTRHSHKRRRR